MKVTAFFIFLVLGTLSLSAQNSVEKTMVTVDCEKEESNKNLGSILEREFVGDFDEIEVSQIIKAEIFKSDTERVVISAPESIIDKVLVDNNAGKLHIRYKSKVRVVGKNCVTAKIYVRDFNKLSVDSLANIILRGNFVQKNVEINASSSGTIVGDIGANNLSIEVNSSGNFKGKIWAVDLKANASSSGDIHISGEAKNALLGASSSGDILGKGLVAESVDARASSSGDIKISVSLKLTAAASSSGDVEVYKRGELSHTSVRENSSGSVRIYNQ